MVPPPPAPIAEELAKKQKEISVSEFFERNKHILGFDSGTRALITAVKEAVDNALDACEEANILPEVNVEIRKGTGDELTMIVEDNGPGIVKKQMGNIFARLLYGSRFHSIRQSRGQQGIGISAAVMYGQLTTGKPAIIESKIGDKYPVVRVHLKLDTRNNRPDIVKEELDSWEKPHGTRVAISMSAKYQRGAQSVFEYLRGTAIVNPHARITFKEPDGTITLFERATDQVPPPTKEIKPHPEGIELGILMKMAKNTETKKVTAFLTNEFSSVGLRTAQQIAEEAAKILGLKRPGDFEDFEPAKIEVAEAKALMEAFKRVKIQAPPTDCLSPIGEVLVKKGLKKELPDTEFIATVTRPPNVYAGRPFQVEVGIAYGGGLPKDEQVRVIRFANRVPLLYQKGACVSTQSIEGVDWRRYELEQRGGKGMPVGPAVMLVHIASVNVPFTSEAKEAIADIDIIFNEIKLALQECGRKLGSHLRKKAKYVKMREKEALIRKVIPRLAEKSALILGKPTPNYEPVIARIMNNMMITDEIKYHGGHKKHNVEIKVTNYCAFGKTFELYSVIPHGVRVENVDPAPLEVTDGLIVWKMPRIPTTENASVRYTLCGLDQADYDETDLYVKGIDEDLVIGAEAWKGKEDEDKVERIVRLKPDGTPYTAEELAELEAAEKAAQNGADGDGGATLAAKDDRPKKAAKPKAADMKEKAAALAAKRHEGQKAARTAGLTPKAGAKKTPGKKGGAN
ncbi:MAG TPA: DNA topoisomerase VI subunit B [Candidatus Thermoplasmatota archaeon]|nr:DNA topoisomerase VI subunit B [Candidatus Thermoplasmatota archaeon]